MTYLKRRARRWIAASAGLLLAVLAGPALANELLDMLHPLNTEWRRITGEKASGAGWSVPAGVSGSREDDIVVTVARAENRDDRKVLTGWSLVVVAIDCRRHRFSMGDMQKYDLRGRKTSFYKASEASPAVAPVDKGSVIEAVADDVCVTAKSFSNASTPKVKPKAEPRLSSGTGWLSERGYIVTASHVIAGANSIHLYQEGRSVGEAEVVADDPSNDVAVLKPAFDVSPYVGLRLRGRPAGLGTRIFTLGYPLADTLGVRSVKLATGDITGLTGIGDDNRPDDPRFAQVSLPVQSGNSGGPVIDDLGTVAGMVVAKSNYTEEAEILQNLNFAIKASYIAPLLDELPRIGRARVVDPANTNRVEAVKSSIFMILVEGSEP